jgi:uncharacterized protein (TIGR02678 family)
MPNPVRRPPCVPPRSTTEQSPSLKEAEALDHLRLDDRRRAVRVLLRKPLLLAEEPADVADFARVRRHAQALREWFSRHAGWSLDISAEFARLRKTPGDLRDATRPAIDPRSNEPFTRRRYVLLCLALAALTRAERQTTLGRVASQIAALWAHEPAFERAGLTFHMELHDDRRDLVHVIRLLLAWQVLHRVDGTEERFVHDSSQDVLYGVRHIVLSRLLAARRPPSLVSASDCEGWLAAMVEEPMVDTDEQKNRLTRLGIVRRLLDDPVVYYRELSAEEQSYLPRQRWHILAQIVEATGFEPEERAEGFALADPFGDCSDLGMPEEGTDGHATILVAEFLAARHKVADDHAVAVGVIADFLTVKANEHRRHWRREVTVPGSETDFAYKIIARLAGLGLVRVLGKMVVPMPAIHRFRLREAV